MRGWNTKGGGEREGGENWSLGRKGIKFFKKESEGEEQEEEEQEEVESIRSNWLVAC